MSSISEMFPGAEGKVRRDEIRARWGIEAQIVGGEHVLPCELGLDGKPDLSKIKIQTHPLNDRSYVEEQCTLNIRVSIYVRGPRKCPNGCG